MTKNGEVEEEGTFEGGIISPWIIAIPQRYRPSFGL